MRTIQAEIRRSGPHEFRLQNVATGSIVLEEPIVEHQRIVTGLEVQRHYLQPINKPLVRHDKGFNSKKHYISFGTSSTLCHQPTLCLRSPKTPQLTMHRTTTQTVEWAFLVAAPAVWRSGTWAPPFGRRIYGRKTSTEPSAWEIKFRTSMIDFIITATVIAYSASPRNDLCSASIM